MMSEKVKNFYSSKHNTNKVKRKVTELEKVHLASKWLESRVHKNQNIWKEEDTKNVT